MPRARRLTAILAMLLLTQLVLVGSGFACTMAPMADAGAPTATPVVDAVSTRTADDDCADAMPRDDAASRAAIPGSDEAPAPCPLPWAPAGCHGVPCAPAAIVASAAALAPTGATVATEARARTPLTPNSVVRAPELPPPRA